jgi:hypothetical protein
LRLGQQRYRGRRARHGAEHGAAGELVPDALVFGVAAIGIAHVFLLGNFDFLFLLRASCRQPW